MDRQSPRATGKGRARTRRPARFQRLAPSCRGSRRGFRGDFGPFLSGIVRHSPAKSGIVRDSPPPDPPGRSANDGCAGQSHLEISERLADIAIVGRGRARPPFPLLPPSGGRSGGGSRPWVRRVPPASREARTRMRASGPPCRRDAGAPRRFTDERDRESSRPGGPAPGSTPLPTSPLEGGRSEDGAARLPVRPSRAVPNGAPDSSPLPGRKSEGGLSSAIALTVAAMFLTARP